MDTPIKNINELNRREMAELNQKIENHNHNEDLNRRCDIETLKAEMIRNDATISSLRTRNIEIAIDLVSLIHGVSVGDIVCASYGIEYKVCSIHPRILLLTPANLERQVKPWIMGNAHTKDGLGWDTTKEINLYGNWEKVS